MRAHEQEHVANAYSKASLGNGKVISATVSIHMDICPECGRSYVSGGTQIHRSNIITKKILTSRTLRRQTASDTAACTRIMPYR